MGDASNETSDSRPTGNVKMHSIVESGRLRTTDHDVEVTSRCSCPCVAGLVNAKTCSA